MAVSEVAVDGVVFPQVARPPGSERSHFLAGAGVRGMEIGGNFIKFTAIGVYVEDAAVPALAKRWAGKTADELASDTAFFRDVVTGKKSRCCACAERCGGLITESVLVLYAAFDWWPRRRRRVREVHKGDDDPAAHRRAVLGEGDRELRRVLEGHRRVHGRRGRRRGEVQGGIQARDLPAGRVHPLHAFPTRGPRCRVLQGLVGAGGRRRGDREQAALRGRAGVHHRGARRLAGREAEHRGEGVGAPQGDHPLRRRAAAG